MIQEFLDWYGRKAAVAAVALAVLNLYGVWPVLNSAVEQVAAAPLLLAGALAWVWMLRYVFGLLSRVSARVA